MSLDDQSNEMNHFGDLFGGPHWKCPRCPGGFIAADSPEKVADMADDHLQDHHGITLEEYQKRGGFSYVE